MSSSKHASAAAAVGDRDHISNLPDGVLQHLLSFLPAQDAVRACVLAKRWRHMWKSTPCLRFLWGGTNEPESIEDIRAFVDHLLRLRICGGTPLDTCEFRLGEADDDDMSRVDLWIRIALQCKVQVLRLISSLVNPGIWTSDDHPFFITQYLKKLELRGVDLPSRLFLDFCFCPNLEDLEIVNCLLRDTSLISSQSLNRLTIEDCYFGDDCRMHICAPNVVSLWLDVRGGRTPSLQRMSFLITASIKIKRYDDRSSAKSDDGDYSNQSILLQGLSEVQNLSLIAYDDKMFIFRRDLKFCSSFNNLKSLLLNEYWCEPADFSALACLLKLCPVLEKLTLQLYSRGPNHKVAIKLSCKPLEISTDTSQHLKTLEVNCEVYDKRVRIVLTFLSKKLNIWFEFIV